jgi:hypothetical protein
MVMKVIDGDDLAGCRRDVDLSRAWLTQPEGIGDICLRNDQNIPFNHLHHHHGIAQSNRPHLQRLLRRPCGSPR